MKEKPDEEGAGFGAVSCINENWEERFEPELDEFRSLDECEGCADAAAGLADIKPKADEGDADSAAGAVEMKLNAEEERSLFC